MFPWKQSAKEKLIFFSNELFKGSGNGTQRSGLAAGRRIERHFRRRRHNKYNFIYAPEPTQVGLRQT